MIYGLIEWRFIPTRWKLEKIYMIASERSERAEFCISALKHTILLSIYTLLINHCLSVQYILVFVTLVIMVLFIILTRKHRNLRKTHKLYQASGASEPKFLYFCVGNTFYIPTRNSRKCYKWLRASYFLCVSETYDSSQYFVGESHSLSVQCVLMFVTLVMVLFMTIYIPTRNSRKTQKLLRASRNRLYFCVRNIYFFIPTRKPETHEKAILIASEPKFSSLSRRKHIFFTCRPENQKIWKTYTSIKLVSYWGANVMENC